MKCRGSSGYPPAEGRVEHSQRNSSQENYIIFSLQTQRRVTGGSGEANTKKEEEEGKRRWENVEIRDWSGKNQERQET